MDYQSHQVVIKRISSDVCPAGITWFAPSITFNVSANTGCNQNNELSIIILGSCDKIFVVFRLLFDIVKVSFQLNLLIILRIILIQIP